MAVRVGSCQPERMPCSANRASGDDVGLAYGFGFDTRAEIGKRLGPRVSSWSRHIIGFGTEPVHMSLEKVLQILSSVLRAGWRYVGQLLAEYP